MLRVSRKFSFVAVPRATDNFNRSWLSERHSSIAAAIVKRCNVAQTGKAEGIGTKQKLLIERARLFGTTCVSLCRNRLKSSNQVRQTSISEHDRRRFPWNFCGTRYRGNISRGCFLSVISHGGEKQPLKKARSGLFDSVFWKLIKLKGRCQSLLVF